MGSLLDRCIRAAQIAAAACEMALAADDSYTNPGTEPYSEAHLTLVSCVSVCTLVVKALREGEGDVALLQWCADVCAQCAASEALETTPEQAWNLVTRACKKCAFECHDLIKRTSHYAQTALQATRDTDFQILQI